MKKENSFYYVLTEINPGWCEYDQRVATCMLDNWGKIFMNREYNEVIDNEWDQEYCLECEENGNENV